MKTPGMAKNQDPRRLRIQSYLRQGVKPPVLTIALDRLIDRYTRPLPRRPSRAA